MDIKINPKFFLFKDMFYVYFFLCIFVYIVWIWDHQTEEEKKKRNTVKEKSKNGEPGKRQATLGKKNKG